MSANDKSRQPPQLSDKGKKKAADKYARQAAALRENLRRRREQRRGHKDGPAGGCEREDQ